MEEVYLRSSFTLPQKKARSNVLIDTRSFWREYSNIINKTSLCIFCFYYPMLRRLSNQDRHKQLDLLKFKRMSSQKNKKVLKKTVKTPFIVESDDESDMKPIRS